MSDIIEFPGAGVAGSKKAGRALIGATLNRISSPLSVAGQCRDELRVLPFVNNVGLHRGYLPAARLNHGLMHSRAALVSATHAALVPIAYPHIVATPIITAETAFTMLSVLFRGVGKPKNVETAALVSACVDMFAPGADEIGKATGLWTPVSTHPAILALAVRQLVNTAVFTSVAELREAMIEARRTIVHLLRSTDDWMELLRNSDRVLFEFDRAAWMQAHANVGSDVVELMQDPDEAGDEDENEPPSPRWCALEAMRAKSK